MKYMQDGGFQSHPLMRLTLGLTLALLLGFWCTNVAMYFSRMSLRPASVVAYYNGSEEDFRPPRSAASMLETTHTHLPMMGIVLLFLTHLAIFVPLSPAAKKAFIGVAFTSAVLEEGAGWLVRFVSPGFAPLKVAGFLGLQTSILFLIAVLGVFLLSGKQTRTARRAERADSRGRRAADAEDEAAVPAPSVSASSTTS
jgi:hypothetical protein